ncbi:DUF4860 domain-containing protein [Anaerolentibacter hominis]|uniref:DUF4860 domain-containing protein n=1 Tax=Anaerolentibacter hominis TaxID=3079009 RepID=UPI0031B7F144
MKYADSKHRSIEWLAALLLFFVFVISSLLLVIAGTRVYRQTVSNMNSNYTLRTAAAYVTEKIRQNDTADGVSLGTSEHIPVLMLEESIDGTDYITYLYQYDGVIKELFIGKEQPFAPENGQDIMEVSLFRIQAVSDGLYRIHIEAEDGEITEQLVSVRSVQGS